MAQPPPRPAASRAGGPASPGGNGASAGARAKEGEGQPQTFFLGRYRVVDEIGVGGMASVHLARMDGPGGFQKWVAIKRIHPHLVEDDQFVDMFLDEARIAAGINHANVAQVFDLGKDDNTYWIAMEYLHGEPLREVMRRAEERGQRIGPELAARICADAAEGLHAAHELRGKNGQLLGLVHRDVTPHNLFLTYDGYTKVVDFGIAKVADRLASTRAGTLKGKLAYMSPEQVRGAEVDRTTDIFALGVVLWEITTNQRLFRMDTDLDTLEKVQACQVPPPSTLVPGYPPELEQVVLKALAKRKQDRYQTAREFSRALQTYLVRSGHFVGPEEVAQFVRAVFADRIQKREAHLAWAAEVTSTVNVDKLRGGKGAGEEAPLDEGQRKSRVAPVSPPTPASGERQKPPQQQQQAQMASQSLMDDDEDVPTTVAMREQLEVAVRNATAPRPAAGLPAPPAQPGPPPPPSGGPSPASYAGASYAANAAMRPGGFPQNNPAPPPYGAPPPSPYGRPPYGAPAPDERTAAIQGPSEDLGSTVALPSMLDAAPRPGPAYNQQFAPPQGGMGMGQNGQPPGPGMQQFGPPQFGPPQGGPSPTFGNPALNPVGVVGGVPMNLPPIPIGQPQSQIETALSLPRPDPAALWLAQQEKQRGERRNTGVLIAVVALTALCVIGIGVLVVLKVRKHPADTTPAGSASAAVSAATSAAAPPASAASSADAPPATSAAATPTATASAAAGKGDNGYLTITCTPYCDDVVDQGKSLGAAPVVRQPVSPGAHKVTLKKGKTSKTITVNVVSGQVASQNVKMN
jgi:serine/threonine-protein kinase